MAFDALMSLEENGDLAEFMRSNPGQNSPGNIDQLWDLNEIEIPVPGPEDGSSGTAPDPDEVQPDARVIPATSPDDDTVSFNSSGFIPDSGIASSADISGIPGSESSLVTDSTTVKIYRLVSTPLGPGNR